MTYDRAERHLVIALWAVGVIAVLLIVWGVGEAFAHSAVTGWEYPFERCHDNDCAEIADSRVHTSSEGYVVDGHFVVPQSQVRQSPDGHYHACFPTPNKLLCFFAPPTGS